MNLPPLPERLAESWDMRLAFERTDPLFGVSAHAGRVLVGGTKLHRMQPGHERWQRRDLPDGLGIAHLVAQEPWAPWRQAVASEGAVTIFLGKEGNGRIAQVRSDEGTDVTNLVWGRVGKRSALFVLWDDGQVVRLYPERGDQDVIQLPWIGALAGDERGHVAMYAVQENRIYVSDGGDRLQFGSIAFPKDWYDALPDPLDDPLHLAVAGKAVAMSIGWRGAFLSRDLVATPLEKIDPLSHAGALVFEGSSPDAALFGAVCTEAFSSIVRVDASGRAVRIGDVQVDKGRAWPIDDIAWDATRRSVFGVHRQAGVVVATAPDAKGGKRGAVN